MTEHLQHDPKTKRQIKDTLDAFLYDPVRRQFKQRLDQIIVRNAVTGGYTHKSFMHKNVLYNCDSDPLPRKMNRLVPTLHQDMGDYLRDAKHLNEKEVPFVIGYINQVLNASNNLNDYLRLLPEAVHMPVVQLIATCPCQAKLLHEDAVVMLQEKNQTSIQMMKARMVINLIT